MLISILSPFINQGAKLTVKCEAALLSTTNSTFLCFYKNVAGRSSLKGPSILFWTILAFVSEKAKMKICLAFIIVWIPIVMAFLGTFSNPQKELAASHLVCLSKLIILVVDFVVLPGSLKPMCPVLPTPKIWTSIPPTSMILAS